MVQHEHARLELVRYRSTLWHGDLRPALGAQQVHALAEVAAPEHILVAPPHSTQRESRRATSAHFRHVRVHRL